MRLFGRVNYLDLRNPRLVIKRNKSRFVTEIYKTARGNTLICCLSDMLSSADGFSYMTLENFRCVLSIVFRRVLMRRSRSFQAWRSAACHKARRLQGMQSCPTMIEKEISLLYYCSIPSVKTWVNPQRGIMRRVRLKRAVNSDRKHG